MEEKTKPEKWYTSPPSWDKELFPQRAIYCEHIFLKKVFIYKYFTWNNSQHGKKE